MQPYMDKNKAAVLNSPRIYFRTQQLNKHQRRHQWYNHNSACV